MATPTEALNRRNNRQNCPSTPSTTPYSTICSSFLKQVLLHDWWLIKADSDSHGKRLGIGGFTSKESQGIRSFSSAPIVKRHDAVTLRTIDGITVLVHGHLNRSRTLENGFSLEVCEHFLIGFPYYWEEFATLSVSDEQAHFSLSKGIPCSDACKTSVPGDHGTNMLCRNIFDDILQKSCDDAFHCSGASTAKKENLKSTVSTPDETLLNHKKINAEQKRKGYSNVEDVERSGPLTRSRARYSTTRTITRSMH
ncbi:hypothetical protein DH2020_050060 [Rehmannia glutinosa]|uniref:SANTA domain-containing protein n=1 Tax=Rehmannia glutinosa TaxID=99300 RepID=A0ABR0U1K5_REHGL